MAYVPRIVRGPLPEPPTGVSLEGSPFAPGGIWIGGFAALALTEIEVWRRLIRSEGHEAPVALFEVDPSTLRDALPPSRHASTFVLDESAAWRELIAPDRPTRSFAVAPGLVMIGPPTEEAWEEFSGRLAR